MGRSSIRRAKLTFFRGGGGNETLTPMATGASVKVILPEYFTRQQVIIDLLLVPKEVIIDHANKRQLNKLKDVNIPALKCLT